MRSKTEKIKFVLYWLIAGWMPRSSLFPPAKWLRSVFAKWIMGGRNVGKHINIEHGAEFSSMCCIGDYSGIGIHCTIEGPVVLGKNVMMGPWCNFYTRNHISDRTDTPMQLQGLSVPKPITVGNDVWFGSNVIVLPGVTIGDGCIIGAGAVVTKNIPEYSVAVGVPAKIVKSRRS